MISGYQFFKMYTRCNLHFTTNFDLFKYGCTRSISKENYNNRNDRLRFESFSTKFSTELEAFNFCVANFVHNDEKWFYGEFDDALFVYKRWKCYIDGVKYNFNTEVEKINKLMIDNNFEKIETMFLQTKSGNKPPLLQLILHKEITPECVCILDNEYIFLDKWISLYSDVDPLIEKILHRLTKYKRICILLTSKELVSYEH